MAVRSLDLRGTPCPVNFIRCRLALESMQSGECLDVQLDRGEPEEMVIPGLRDEGHQPQKRWQFLTRAFFMALFKSLF